MRFYRFGTVDIYRTITVYLMLLFGVIIIIIIIINSEL